MSKKSLLYLLAVLAISSPAFASYMFNNTFYVRGDMLGSKFWNTKYYDSLESHRIKSKESLGADIGLGYNFFSGLRAELVATNLFSVRYVRPASSNKNMKAKGNALMLRGAYDIYDYELFNLFIGGGIGMSRIKIESQSDWQYFDATGALIRTVPKPASKWKRNFAYNLLTGISFDMGPETTLEIGYLYADYGVSNGLKFKPDTGKFALRSHNIFLGVRYEL